MRPKGKIVTYPHDVFTVFLILVSQSLQYLDLNLALLMQLLPVFEDLNSHIFFGLVIKASQHYTKGTSSELFLNLKPVKYLILGLI